jgi:hypothetical protein
MEKAGSLQWKHPPSSQLKKFKPKPSVGKIVLFTSTQMDADAERH